MFLSNTPFEERAGIMLTENKGNKIEIQKGRPFRNSVCVFIFLLAIFLLSSCFPTPATPYPTIPPLPTKPTATPVPFVTSTAPPEIVPKFIYYVDPVNGSDGNMGTIDQPWLTIDKAVQTVTAGDKVMLRGGQYYTIFGGWVFQNTGTKPQPITFTNFPGEQVVIQISSKDFEYRAFRCWYSPIDPETWHTPKADFIRIVGTDVDERELANGVKSHKGIVISGEPGEQSAGIEVAGCDNWEIAGIDFLNVGYGITTKKRNFSSGNDYSADEWYVHDNRVFNFYRESGMQFNGNRNLIEHNEFYKVSDELNTPYGCQHLNILGNNSVIRGNTINRMGSKAKCGGIMLEWDMADENIFEQNEISDVEWGFHIAGGDNNIIRYNIISMTNGPENNRSGIEIYSFDDNKKDWPCDETVDSAQTILPSNNPADPEYKYYYNPRNCHSFGNQLENNSISGFKNAIKLPSFGNENFIIEN